MKNKKLTYLLIVLVLGLWGMIVYRIFNAVTANDDDNIAQSVKPLKEALNDYAMVKDTATLSLHYSDPFKAAQNIRKDTVAASHPRVVIRHNLRPAPPAINWSVITYSGYIRNPGSKKLIALLNINGRSAALAEGETREQVKLLKNLRDSIKISYQGKTKFITIKSAAL
ncbi:MAG: hypothetical protein ACTHJ8_16820 [Mucilaginibacter sp.]